jgi:uncharacterized repeat protein (TIGR03806 family)
MRRALVLVAIAGCGDGGTEPCDPLGPMCKQLSSYALEEAVPYGLATPLFSDYTVKDRSIVLPPGESLVWRDDRRDPAGERRTLETRLLIKQDAGWTGASYLFPEDSNDPADAELAIAGAQLTATWTHDDGSEKSNSYVVPNKNQCKECHAEHDEVLDLLGPKARHLNTGNQLVELVDSGVVTGAPARAQWPAGFAAYDPASGTIEQRARAWLDINCSFCHNERGVARTSGLYLTADNTDPLTLGICKPPVAAGRGSGGRLYGIVPGQPDASIMTFRIESTEPDIRMPELGRNLVDSEGAGLIRAWIAQLPGTCP